MGGLGSSSQFFFVCCNDYDETLDILCTHDPDVKYDIQRNVQPDSTFIYDMMLQTISGDGGPLGRGGQLLHLLSNTDEEFFVDIIEMNKKGANPADRGVPDGQAGLDSVASADGKQAPGHYPKQFYLRSYSGFSSQWPYISF